MERVLFLMPQLRRFGPSEPVVRCLSLRSNAKTGAISFKYPETLFCRRFGYKEPVVRCLSLRSNAKTGAISFKYPETL